MVCLCEKTVSVLFERQNVGAISDRPHIAWMLCEKPDSVLFFDTAGAKKSTIICKQMKRRVYFASEEATKGSAPRPCDLFSKRSIKNFREWVVLIYSFCWLHQIFITNLVGRIHARNLARRMAWPQTDTSRPRFISLSARVTTCSAV